MRVLHPMFFKAEAETFTSNLIVNGI